MPIGPQYQSSYTPGLISESIKTGQNNSLSLRERNQTMQIREQENARRQQEFDQEQVKAKIMAPITEAKAKSDMWAIETHLKGLKNAEESRGQALQLMPTVREEFGRIMSMEDPEDREMLAIEWVSQRGHIANIAEFKDEMAAKKEIVADIIKESSGLRALKAKTAEEKELISARTAGQVEVAGVKATTPPKTEFFTLMTARSDALAAGDSEVVALYDGRISKLTNISPERKQKVEALLGLKREAEARGDAEGAKYYGDALEKETTMSGVDPLKQAMANRMSGGTPPAPAATPAPAVVQPPAPTPAPAAKPAQPKLYQINGDQVSVSRELPFDEFLAALQEAVDDGVLSADDARAAARAQGATPRK
jgi:hypothetical protein